MFFVLLALWIIFNARLSLDVVLVGIVLSAVLTWFGQRYCRWSAESDRAGLRMAWQGLRYLSTLVVEIVKANFAVIKCIFSKDADKIMPILFFFDTKLKTNVAKTTLANSITLTPGTYTIGIYDSTFAVHALNQEFADGTIDSDFNHRLIALEGTDQANQEEANQ
ncbi:MAG: Na+/H+ antiporter subunit E [Faecalibacterium sp.]